MRKDEFPIIDKHVHNEINAVLEQIRDEVKQNIPLNDGIEGYNTGYAQGIQKALRIIDKYKVDSGE